MKPRMRDRRGREVKFKAPGNASTYWAKLEHEHRKKPEMNMQRSRGGENSE